MPDNSGWLPNFGRMALNIKRMFSFSVSRAISKRIAREKKTIALMVTMYCNSHHSRGNGLCDECLQLLDYAEKRLDNCLFKNDKPTCTKCRVHCYNPVIREKVRQVMRYSGPRMIYRHPLLAFYHLIDERRSTKGGA